MNKKIIFWSAFIVLSIFILYLINDILLPFIVAMIFAYLLDPLADKLEERNISRNVSTIIIISAFFALVTISVVLIAPLLYSQFTNMLKKIPEYIELANEQIIPYLSDIINRFAPNAIENAKESLSDISQLAFKFIKNIAGNIWNSGLAIVNIFSLLFVTPIVTYYILRDWDKMMEKISSWLPKDSKETILEQVNQIDITLSAYIRGQTNVCLLLGIFYAVALSLAGLDFGFTIGLLTGLLSFIPYVGVLFGCTIGMIIAFLQFDSILNIAVIGAIFLVGQFVEGNFVTPKLVGDKVGLHPVWIIFSLMVGGTILGFLGILIAIPVASVMGVLIKFFFNKYLNSDLYDPKNKGTVKTELNKS